MTPVGTEDCVTMGQLRTNRGRDRLLANVRMARSMDQSLLMATRKLFLRLPDDLHGAIQTEHLFGGQRHSRRDRLFLSGHSWVTSFLFQRGTIEQVATHGLGCHRHSWRDSLHPSE